MKIITVTVAMICLLTCCATPYQPAGFRGGYAEEPIGNDVVAVSFRGNGYTPADMVVTYVQKRAFAYCAEQGKQGYEIVNTAADHSQELHTGAFDGMTKSTSIYTVSKHSATLYIRCNNAAH